MGFYRGTVCLIKPHLVAERMDEKTLNLYQRRALYDTENPVAFE